MAADLSRRDYVMYLVALAALASASVGAMYVLFATGYQRFLRTLRRDPGHAIHSEPMSLVLVGVVLVLVFLTVVLVVLFGAKNLPEPANHEQ